MIPIELRSGDLIFWSLGNSKITRFLSWLLSLFESSWRKRGWKPWHTGHVIKVFWNESFVTLEATDDGMQAVTYDNLYQLGDIRIFRWLDNPTQQKIDDFTEEHLGKSYDMGAYIGTIIAYLWQKLTKRSWYHRDEEYTCWESISDFCRAMGKPLQPEYEYPLISKMIDKVENEVA